MRVAAGLAAFFLVSGVAAVAQHAPLPTTTIPDSANTTCLFQSLPDKGHHEKGGSTTSICKTTVVEGCPVDMRVRQRMGGATVAVDENGIERRVFAQKLRLILNHLRADNPGRKLVSATVTVYGTSGKARMKPLGSGPDDYLKSGTMARTLNVDLAGGVEPGFSGDFLLPGFTSASRVDLETVTYDDGSTWKLSKNESCRVAPDPLMLIKQ